MHKSICRLQVQFPAEEMQPRPFLQQRTSPAAARHPPSLQDRGQGVPPNFTIPLPPQLPSYPCNGITLPHPHPVAPFPPPPHGTLHPGPIPPPPPHTPSPPHHSQPFYTLAMTHLPPTVHQRPRPHSSLFPHSPPPPQFPTPPRPPPPPPPPPPPSPHHPPPPPPPSPHHPPSPSHPPHPATPTTETRPALQPRPQLLQPVPLRFPYPTTVNVTCSVCGSHLIVDLTAHHLTNYRSPPSRPLPTQGSPVFWRLPFVRPSTSLASPTLTPVSTTISAALVSPHGTHLTSLCQPLPPPPPPPREREKTRRPRKSSNILKVGGGTLSRSRKTGGGKSAGSRTAAGIIPYRRRRRTTTIETQARQQLELEFASVERPTVMRMGEIAGRLGVSRDFVRQWFSGRHQRLQQKVSLLPGETAGNRTIPSVTHEITVEVPLSDSYLFPAENGVQTVILLKE